MKYTEIFVEGKKKEVDPFEEDPKPVQRGYTLKAQISHYSNLREPYLDYLKKLLDKLSAYGAVARTACVGYDPNFDYMVPEDFERFWKTHDTFRGAIYLKYYTDSNNQKHVADPEALRLAEKYKKAYKTVAHIEDMYQGLVDRQRREIQDKEQQKVKARKERAALRAAANSWRGSA